MASAPRHTIYNYFSGQYNVTVTNIIISQSSYQHNNMLQLITQKQAIFAFAASAILNFLQLKSDSPFDTHPKLMAIAITSVLVYCIACNAELRISSSSISPNYANAIHHAVRFLGYFSLASLASILAFPISVRPIVYLVLALFSVWLLHWVRNRILIGRGYTYNSPSGRVDVDVPSIHDSADIDTLPV